MLVTLKDPSGKSIYVNPNFVSVIKSGVNGFMVIYDVSNNMFFIRSDENLDVLLEAVAKCNQTVFLPNLDQKASHFLPQEDNSTDQSSELEDIEQLIEEVAITVKKKARVKKSIK